MISMRAGPAAFQCDWLRAGFTIDLPVFIYSHTETDLKFLSGQARCLCQLSIWFTGLSASNHQDRAYWVLYFLWT